MPRDLRRHQPLNLEQGIVAMGAGKKMEHVVNAFEGSPAQLQRRDGIGKARGHRVGGNGGDLGYVLGECLGIGRHKVCGGDPGKRRDSARGGPVLKERIVARRDRRAGGAMVQAGSGFDIRHWRGS